MVAQRIRIPCPSCSQNLQIRIGHIGKKGECKYCGHRFRARAGGQPAPKPGPTALPDRIGTPWAGLVGQSAGFGRVVQTLERELQQTWALLTARQASVLEQLIAELGERSVPGQARAQASLPSPRMRADGPAESHEIDPFEVEPLDSPFQTAETFVVPSTAIPRANAVELTGLGIEVAGTEGDDSWPVRAGGDVVESGGASLPPDVMERLIRERAECDRHREEARTLRSELEGLRAEVQRLRPLAEKLKRIRAERDRLRVERDKRQREAEESRARLVEVQLTLVEAEAELDDCRARTRLAWERRRQGRLDEAESLLVEYEESSRFEFELEAWSEQITIASRRLDSEGTDLPRA